LPLDVDDDRDVGARISVRRERERRHVVGSRVGGAIGLGDGRKRIVLERGAARRDEPDGAGPHAYPQ
jgi:hypothetical protein